MPERTPSHGGCQVEQGAAQPSVLFLRGEIDVANVDGLRRAIEQASARSDTVILDMADTTFIDGSVLGVLASANARLSGGLQVRRACPFVAKVFALVAMEHLLADRTAGPGSPFEAS